MAGCWRGERVCWLKIGIFLGFLDGIPEGNGTWGDAGTSREGQDGCVRGCGIDQVYQGLIRIRVRILSLALLEHRTGILIMSSGCPLNERKTQTMVKQHKILQSLEKKWLL